MINTIRINEARIVPGRGSALSRVSLILGSSTGWPEFRWVPSGWPSDPVPSAKASQSV